MTIDWWTLGIQTVNMVVLVWLLGRFFWRPVAAMIEQRQAATKKALADVETGRAALAAAQAEIECTRAGFEKEREAILAAANEEAESALTVRLDEATKEATVLQEAAKTRIEKDKAAAERAWSERARRLAIDIAGRLAARLDGVAVRAAFLDWLMIEIRRLPDPDRQALAGGDVALEAISAAPLEAAEQESARTKIDEAFGGHPQITFTVDPALIAGLELHGPHLVMSNSWRADLAQILADIAHDQQP